VSKKTRARLGPFLKGETSSRTKPRTASPSRQQRQKTSATCIRVSRPWQKGGAQKIAKQGQAARKKYQAAVGRTLGRDEFR